MKLMDERYIYYYLQYLGAGNVIRIRSQIYEKKAGASLPINAFGLLP
jgi:hypothetical protein